MIRIASKTEVARTFEMNGEAAAGAEIAVLVDIERALLMADQYGLVFGPSAVKEMRGLIERRKGELLLQYTEGAGT